VTLISLLIDIEEDGDVLTEEELYGQCVMLLLVGHETTRKWYVHAPLARSINSNELCCTILYSRTQ
jgi:cytochrome P450